MQVRKFSNLKVLGLLGPLEWARRRAMVGEGGGERVEDMSVEMHAPSIIAKESVEFAHCRILSLI
jgi:hypothetical protein